MVEWLFICVCVVLVIFFLIWIVRNVLCIVIEELGGENDILIGVVEVFGIIDYLFEVL